MMEASFSLFFIVLVIAPTAVQPTYTSDCKPDLDNLKLTKSTIDYNSFCAKVTTGGDKLACRFPNTPCVFLVCQEPKVGNKRCKTFIKRELLNLRKLQKAGIKTVGFLQERIDNVRCGDNPDTTCSGFVEYWVTKNEGIHGHIRLAIADAEVDLLTQQVITLTRNAGGNLRTTYKDLYRIRKYMRKHGNYIGRYRQICDLQGFFLKAGGFQVNDPEGIKKNLALGDRCGISHTSGEREPTTKEVFDALKYMSNKFKKAHAQKIPQIKHV